MGAKRLSSAKSVPGKTLAKAVKRPKRHKKTPHDILDGTTDFFQTRKGLYTAAAICVALVFVTIGACVFYKKELEKTAPLRAGMKVVKKFVQAKNPDLRTRTNTEILLEMQKLADELSAWTKKTDKLDTAIADIDGRLKKDWVVYGGNLYSFKKKALDQEQAKKICEDEESNLVSVVNEEEEDFLEKHITKDIKEYWIGLYRKGYTWAWLDDSDFKFEYWAVDEPDTSTLPSEGTENCVIIANSCSSSRKCWQDIKCNEKKYLICKLRPNKAWME